MMKFRPKHIRNSTYPSAEDWSETYFPMMISVAKHINYTFPQPFLSKFLTTNNVSIVQRHITDIFKFLYTIVRLEEVKFRNDSIKHYVNKRCDNYIDNQKSMIDSILSRKRRVITLDRILVQDPLTAETTLITDPEQIKSQTNQHFQTVAGGRHQPKQLNPRWTRQYTPLSGIKDEWYSTLMSSPTRDEWQSVINSLPNGKAAGPSGVSNEMLKHLGKPMANALWKLICICCQLNDIPADWREAVVYPIPKPTNWECDLNKTRPITLLETSRKALVKIINQRLSHIIANYGILEGGNHAGLPGGSTLPPTRILNALIEDATENKKELWVLFQDLSKAYDRVNGYMLDLAMQRIKIPSAARDFILNLFSCRKNRVIISYGLTDPYDVLIGID